MTSQARNRRTPNKAADAGTDTPKRDPYQLVTDAIIAAIESGVKPWEKSWVNGNGSAVPLRWNGDRYRGVNTIILWAKQLEAGYTSPYFMTYQQALELGGQVKRGEKSTMVVYYGTGKKQDEKKTDEGPNVYRFLKTFSVFSADQCEGLPERYYAKAPQVISSSERIEEIDAIIAKTGAEIRWGGNKACFIPSVDRIHMPEFTAFKSAEFCYATLFHELTHWTKVKSRLDRDFNSSGFGSEGYAKEELVAELSAAFIGSELGFAPYHIEDHASYIANWLKALKDDKRLIFQVAAKAQAAADYILGRSAQKEGE